MYGTLPGLYNKLENVLPPVLYIDHDHVLRLSKFILISKNNPHKFACLF